MIVDLSEVASDPEIGDCFIVQRQSGLPGAGGWIANPPQIIQAYGIVTVATPKDLEMLPEGDRVRGSLHIIYGQQLYVTHEDNLAGAHSGTSDQILWGGLLYRVQAVEPWGPMVGFWHAIAARMLGS